MGGGKPRGLSDLHRAIRNLHDEADIVGYVKQSAKLAASVGLVETGDAEKRPGMGTVGKVSVGPDGRRVEQVLGGPTVHQLPPGRDLKVLTDNRPSPNVMALLKHLMDEVAYGIGLSPALLWEPDKLGSGGIRFVMQKLKRWLKSGMPTGKCGACGCGVSCWRGKWPWDGCACAGIRIGCGACGRP